MHSDAERESTKLDRCFGNFEFPRLRGLVFGAMGEVSKDVNDLVPPHPCARGRHHAQPGEGRHSRRRQRQLAWMIKRHRARVDSIYRAKLLLDRRMFIGRNVLSAGEGRFDAPSASGRGFNASAFCRDRFTRSAARNSMHQSKWH